jgi:regulator of RNase E activity RraA
MKKKLFLLFAVMLAVIPVKSQLVMWTPEDIKLLTKQWTGERLPDGRPKVSDDLLKRLEKVTIEDAYTFLLRRGYECQFENFSTLHENGWVIIHPDKPMIGRVLTAQYMPMRFDLDDYIQEVGQRQDIRRVTNALPVNSLFEGDIYVADGYGKIAEGGTLIGDNVARSIFNNSGQGVIFNGSLRSLEAIAEIEGFNGWIRGFDPSSISRMLLSTVNAPIRIGRATVLPGDVVMARRSGVIFIPPHFVEEIIIQVELAELRRQFNSQQQGRTAAPAGNNNAEFREWLNRQTNLPMTREALNAYFEKQAYEQANPQPPRSQRQ